MKKITLTFLILLFLINNAYSIIDTIRINSKITDVTVFLRGAQVTRQADLRLNKGKFILMIDKLPQEINPQSIQVAKIINCKTLSVKHQLNYQDEGKKEKEEIEIQNKIDLQKLKLKEINNKIKVYDLEEKILLDNSYLSKKDDGNKVNEIKLAADFYRQRLNEIKQNKLLLINDFEKGNKEIQENYTKLNQVVFEKHKTYSQILVAIEAEKEVSNTIEFSYLIASAGWEPLYDFRVDEITKPLTIVYNANVFQSSSEDWKNVNLKLSNNNPSLSGTKPELVKWYIDRKNPYQQEVVKQGIGALRGRVLDINTNEAIPFANIVLSKGNLTIATTTTDLDGQYAIKPLEAGTYSIKVIYIGFDTYQKYDVKVNSDLTTDLDIKMHYSSTQLNEVELVSYREPLIDADVKSGRTVTSESYQNLASKNINSVTATAPGVYQQDGYNRLNMRGSRSDGTAYYVDGQKIISSKQTINYISNTFKNADANLEYTIEIPYTIPSDGQDYLIKIKEVSFPVNYVYYAVPKLDKDVFLTAEIIDWQQLNLISGKTSIYYQGTFTGKSYLDANTLGDTLNVSLGRDKSILVKREGNKKMFDKKIIGSNIKETVGYDITIKNNKGSALKIVIEDQLPISDKKSIEIEMLENANAKIDEKTGELKWELNLEPNEKNLINYKYSVKYPKNTNIILD
jgi:hypothetical protein